MKSDCTKPDLTCTTSEFFSNIHKVADDGLPKIINFNVTTRCNLRCIQCRTYDVKIIHPPTDKILVHLDRLADWLPMPRLAILTGGEPLCHPDILTFVKRLSDRGFFTVLATNGAALTPQLVDKLAQAGLMDITLSLDGIGDVHDKLRNGPGLYQGVMDMIHYMSKETNIRISTLAVISAISAPGLPDLLKKLMLNPRYNSMQLQAVIPTLSKPWDDKFFSESPLWPQNEKELKGVLDAIDQLEQMKKDGAPIYNPASQFKLWRQYFKAPLDYRIEGETCRVGDINYQIMADGSITLCDFYGRLGTIEDAPKALWESDEANKMRDKMRQCSRPCNYFINCCYLEE